MDGGRLDDLIAKHFDGTLSDEERAELERAVASDPEAARRLAQAARDHLDLTVVLGNELPAIPSAGSPPTVKPSSGFRPVWFGMAAGLLLGLVAMVLAHRKWNREQEALAGRKGFHIVTAHHATPLTGPVPDRTDLLAPAGLQHRLRAGTVEFQEATIFSVERPPAGRETVTLKAGHVRFDLESGKGGVLVRTPAGTLTDIGTSFEVQLNPAMDEEDLVNRVRSGRLSVLVTAVVLSGIVEFQSAGQDQPPRRLTPEMGKVALSADASLARVRDREGTASVKPVMHDRWTVAEENLPLEFGDWLQTGKRGANALTVALTNGVQLILGPGTLVELTDLENVNVTEGELEVSCPERTALRVHGPGGASVEASGTKVFRARDEKLSVLEAPPRWLEGYKANASTEAMGSLLANVDGRNVPLYIGYHKVTVDIRDQIARTEIEESFVNTTHTVLEGVFYFPLPQDASISGFGMWIGDEYVHADVVEKQRAREIYETILREKRDPGLLEWAGGNLFKASVYPIGAEKRIKISYTQVLPKTGRSYRYSYALRSEMLRLHPLKELAIDVKISSTEPLESVACPTHTVRQDRTDHAAHVEFAAQEYVPQRDFEVVVGVKGETSALTVVPHRRGDDGYLLAFVNVPAEQEASRDLVPSGEPLSLIVMADTSGSMAGAPRESQLQFLEALLSSLGPKDRFNVMTCDVAVGWAFPEAVENTGANRETAQKFVEKRHPLGWSDLDAAFAAAMDRAAAGTQIVYLGDGAVTTGDADPAAFSKRLQRKFDESGKRGTFHAVAPGSTYESGVLKTVAGLGGGSWRVVGDGIDPAQAATALLREIAAPGLRDAKGEFTGVTVAAQYPGKMPNLPSGTQQVLVGRYDPRAGAAKGRLVVRGMLRGKSVEYAGEFTLPESEAGNSFIPRLWARHHLDHLLDQGASSEIKDRIIALSEDYQIITPYTSFLVLESDADRERFQVKKRFRMRDGEEFFTKGRDDANFDLARKQMLKAERWRKQLRRSILDSLAEMGRDAMDELLPSEGDYDGLKSREAGIGGSFGGEKRKRFRDKVRGISGAVEDGEARGIYDSKKYGERFEEGKLSEPTTGTDWGSDIAEEVPSETAPSPEGTAGFDIQLSTAAKQVSDKLERMSRNHRAGNEVGQKTFYGNLGRFDGRPYSGPQSYDPFAGLFPTVPEPDRERPELSWPQEIRDLLKTLDRRAVITAQPGGLRIVVSGETTDKRWKVTARTSTEHLLANDRWIVVPSPVPGTDYIVQWCSGGERGAIQAQWLLGSVRSKKDRDEISWSAPFTWYFGELASYSYCVPELKKLEDGKAELTLRYPANPRASTIFVIDPSKSAVVEVKQVSDGKVIWSQAFEDFVVVAGAHWPRRVVTRSGEDDPPLTGTISVEALDRAALEGEIAKRLAVREGAIVLGRMPRLLSEAKQAVKDGKAKFEDHWRLLREYAGRQMWERAAAPLEGVAILAKGKRGLAAIRLAFLQASRRLEEFKGMLMESAKELAAAPREADYSCAQHLLNLTHTLTSGQERLDVVRTLKPVFERRKEIAGGLLQWEQHDVNALENLGRPEEVFQRRREMAERYPVDTGTQTAYAYALAQRGEGDAALGHLKKSETNGTEWGDPEIRELRAAGLEILLQSYRLEEVLKYVDMWSQERPKALHSDPLNKYLSSIFMLDREDQGWSQVKAWIAEAAALEKPEGLPWVRFEAAIQHAQGTGYNLYRYRIEPEQARFIAETARRMIDHKVVGSYAVSLLQNGYFAQTDEGRALQAEWYDRLRKGASTLPVEQVQSLFHALHGRFQPAEGDPAWQMLLDSLVPRWEGAPPGSDRTLLENLIVSFGRPELRLKLRRAALARAASKVEKNLAAAVLLRELQSEKWTAEIEAEAAALLPVIVETETRDAGENLSLVAFHELFTWLPSARAEAKVQSLPKVNEMPRRELKAAREAALKEAREAAAALLASMEPREGLQPLRSWILVERHYLTVKLRKDFPLVRGEAMSGLKELMKRCDGKAVEDLDLRDRVLAVRLSSTLVHLATLGEGKGPEVDELQAFLRESDRPANAILEWKELTYRLLVALDRGDEVEAALKDWFAGGAEFVKIRWGRDYAMVLAERNRIDEAVRVLEEIERIDELGYEDFRSLADWFMVQNLSDRNRAARIRSWEVVGESTISNTLYQDLNRYQRSGEGIPSELDEEVPLKFVALFRKAQSPENQVWLLRQYYEATRDFRLLECMPEAVLGQTAQRIYPFLQRIHEVTGLLQEEATLDRLTRHLVPLHEKTSGEVDRRALRLLEFMVEHRAAAQSHGTGPHVAAALRALQEADRGSWTEGEPEPMSSYLAAQGALADRSLAEEQLRQLGGHHRRLPAGTYPRLVVAGHHAQTLWNYTRKEEAIRVLEGSLDEYRASCGGVLPPPAHGFLNTLGSYRETAGEFAAAEKLWRSELALPRNLPQQRWFRLMLHQHYVRALRADAEVSLGKGETLYRAAQQRVLSELEERSDESHTHQLISTLCELWEVAHQHRRFNVRKDMTEFAFRTLPPILQRYQYRGGQSIVSNVAYRLQHDVDARTALEFLIVRSETEPRWLRLGQQDFWMQNGWRFAEILHQSLPLPSPLEERALAIVLRELRTDLRSRQAHNRYVYYGTSNTYFWRAKAGEFAAAALEVAAENDRTEANVAYVAEYLYHGLDRYADAIRILAEAHKKGILGVESRIRLCQYLQWQNRHRESVPFLVRLVEERPDRIDLRTMLMLGWHHSGDRHRLQEVRKAAEEHFKKIAQWSEGVIAQMGTACVQTNLYEEGCAYLREAIALHVKSVPNRGVGDGTLCVYYRELASALSGLGKTDEAVDAAAGAIVSWGRQIEQRAQELARLEEILSKARDLDAYVGRLDAEVRKTGLENPVVRKALGKVYQGKGGWARAAEQYRLAVEGQPNDTETQRALVEVYDKMGDPARAAEQLLSAARLAGHDAKLYQELGDRWRKSGRPEEADRAWSNMVEMLPNESQGHEAFAKVLEESGRMPEAEVQWRQVIRVRTKEPGGYFGLTENLIRQKNWEEAKRTIEHLLRTEWPGHFGNVRQKAEELEKRIK